MCKKKNRRGPDGGTLIIKERAVDGRGKKSFSYVLRPISRISQGWEFKSKANRNPRKEHGG